MKGWKNLNKDLTCREFEFEVGQTYRQNGEVQMCSRGFHFHANPFDLFQFYEFDFQKTVVAEIEASGYIEHADNKSVCSEITIVRILSNAQIKDLGNMYVNLGWGNAGNGNTGRRNTGDRNTGYGNAGDGNTGNWNAGDGNTGNWNKCNFSNGFFNTKDPATIMVFNKLCAISEWNTAIKPHFIYFKKKWSGCITCITQKDIILLQKLPNFDEIIFKEISGFSLNDLKKYEILFRKFNL